MGAGSCDGSAESLTSSWLRVGSGLVDVGGEVGACKGFYRSRGVSLHNFRSELKDPRQCPWSLRHGC